MCVGSSASCVSLSTHTSTVQLRAWKAQSAAWLVSAAKDACGVSVAVAHQPALYVAGVLHISVLPASDAVKFTGWLFWDTIYSFSGIQKLVNARRLHSQQVSGFGVVLPRLIVPVFLATCTLFYNQMLVLLGFAPCS
jgi:hypothetical protein